MGQAADPVDGRADLRLAGQVPPPEQGPREERPVVGIVHQAGHDPVDVSPASPLRCGRRIPLSRCSLNRPYGTVTKRLASRSLSLEAFWAASEAFDRADLDGSRKLLEFALTTDPELRSRPEWTRFSIKRWLGPGVWRVLHPLASLVRSRHHSRLSSATF